MSASEYPAEWVEEVSWSRAGGPPDRSAEAAEREDHPSLAELVIELEAADGALLHAARAERDAWENWQRRSTELREAHTVRVQAAERYQTLRVNAR